jgi:hypothetical protein
VHFFPVKPSTNTDVVSRRSGESSGLEPNEETVRVLPNLVGVSIPMQDVDITDTPQHLLICGYVGSSIYSPATPFIMEQFGVGFVAASLGLTLYVLACKCKPLKGGLVIMLAGVDGMRPMLFSPLSE